MKPGALVIDRSNFFKSETKIQKLFPHMQGSDEQEKLEIINKIMQQKQEIKILE